MQSVFDMYDIAKSLEPPPDYTVSEHAEKTLHLSERTSAIPGLINFDHTPYLRKPLNMFNDVDVTWINFLSGTQLGKTTFLFCLLNYIVDYIPAPTMVLYPSMDIAKNVSKDRIQQLFRDSPSLQKHMTTKADDFQLLQYKLDRMTLRFAWNSSISVSSHPEKFIIKDETACVDPLILKEADDRTKTFLGRKIVEASSPRHMQDNIWRALMLTRDFDYEEDIKQKKQHHQKVKIPIKRWKATGSCTVYFYEVKCPMCGKFQQLFPDAITWDETVSFRELTYRGGYECDECHKIIAETERPDMIKTGRWITKNPGNSSVGFYLSSLYSILGTACTFGEIAAGYLRAHVSKRNEAMEAFVNGYLALPYEEEEHGLETINVSDVITSEKNYHYRKNQLPPEVEIITAAIDVHKRKLYYSVWGWGGEQELDRKGYLLNYGIIDIDVDGAPELAMKHIHAIRMQKFSDKERTLRPIGVGIDSGYKAEEVYSWCRALKWLKPLKGERGDVLVPEGMEKFISITTVLEKTPSGKRIEGGLTLRTVNTGLLKREIYNQIRTGNYNFPVDIDQIFMAQLNSEKLVTRIGKRGKLNKFYVKKKVYEVVGDKRIAVRNHYLDTVVYNRAMVEVLAAGMTLRQAARKYYQIKRSVKASYTEV